MPLDRRSFLQASPPPAPSPPCPPAPRRRSRPESLVACMPGDTVGLIEPAGFTHDSYDLADVKATIAGMGLVPRPRAACRRPLRLSRRHRRGAGRRRQCDVRRRQRQGHFRDPRRVGLRADPAAARLQSDPRPPKLLVGFSDITALHMAIAGARGLHHHPRAGRRQRLGKSPGIRSAPRLRRRGADLPAAGRKTASPRAPAAPAPSAPARRPGGCSAAI